MRPHLLVTGASSQLGAALLPRLLSRTWPVIAWSRHPMASQALSTLAWEQRDLLALPEVGPSVNTLVHLAPIWLLPRLLESIDDRALRVIAISSCSVTSKANSPSASERAVAQRLAQAEQALWRLTERNGHRLTLLRPTMIYGLGLDETIAPMQRFIRRWGFLPLPRLHFGLRQPVHAEDVAGAIFACLQHPGSIGNTYELGGAERLPLDTLAKRLFLDNGRTVRIVPIPRRALEMALRLRALLTGNKQWNTALLDRASADQIADNAPAQRDFAYRPRVFCGRYV